MSKHGPYSWLMHCENVEQQTEITLNTSVTKSTKNSTLYHCDLLPKIWPCVIKTFYQILTLFHCDLLPTIWPCVIMTFYQKSDLVSLWPLGTIVLSMDWHALQPWLWYNNSFNSNIWKGTRYNMTEFVIDKYNISNDKITHWKMHFVRI